MIPIMKKVLHDWYSDKPEISKDYCRIVTNRHLDRLQGMLSKTNGNVVIGGKSNSDDKFMEPTVLTGVSLEDSTMQVYKQQIKFIYFSFIIGRNLWTYFANNQCRVN